MPSAQTQPARKTLEYQIGRLDSILDGLADNLQEAVATAVQTAMTEVLREAIHKAVQDELATVLVNRQEPSMVPPWQPVNRLSVARSGPTSGSYLTYFGNMLVQLQDRLATGLYAVRRFLSRTWSWRWQIVLALGIGLGVGGGRYLIGPLLGVVLLGILVSGVTLVCLSQRLPPRAGHPNSAARAMESGDPVAAVNGVH